MTVTYHRETRHSKCLKCLLLALRHAIKQSRYGSIDWSMKLCWLLTIFQSDAISAHGHTALVSDKHVPAFRFQSVSPGFGTLVWFSCSQGWKWMVHRTITVMSSCCWLLLPSAPRVHKSTELVWHKTSNFTPDMWPPNRSNPNPVDYGIWTVIQECIYQKQQLSSSPISCRC